MNSQGAEVSLVYKLTYFCGFALRKINILHKLGNFKKEFYNEAGVRDSQLIKRVLLELKKFRNVHGQSASKTMKKK